MCWGECLEHAVFSKQDSPSLKFGRTLIRKILKYLFKYHLKTCTINCKYTYTEIYSIITTIIFSPVARLFSEMAKHYRQLMWAWRPSRWIWSDIPQFWFYSTILILFSNCNIYNVWSSTWWIYPNNNLTIRSSVDWQCHVKDLNSRLLYRGIYLNSAHHSGCPTSDAVRGVHRVKFKFSGRLILKKLSS